MNLLQIVLKNMRQRALSTTLTIASVVLGVALAIGILVLHRESESLFGQKDFGYQLILGPATGAPLQLTLNTVYHLDTSPGLLPYSVYEDLTRKPSDPLPPGHRSYGQYVKLAVPMVVGDSFSGRRIVGTSPQMFGVDDAGKPIADGKDDEGSVVINRFEYRKGRTYELAEGRVFAPRKFEGVIGANAAKELKLRLYDPSKSDKENLASGGAFRVTHGMPGPKDKPDVHEPIFRIVGILKPTGTANDRVLFVPFVTIFAIAEHEDGISAQAIQRANLNLGRLPIDQREAALRNAGIDPAKLSESLRTSIGLPSRTPAKAPANPTAPADGDLMQATDDHGHEGHDHGDADAHADHEDHDEPAYTLDANGDIVPNLPPDQWSLSAIFVRVRGGELGGFNVTSLQQAFKVIDTRAAAVSPAVEMQRFFDLFFQPTAALLLAISALVTLVAGASIATTIYNAVSSRLREIAILRALGATRGRILAIICSEAAVIGLIGGVIGLVVGHGMALLASMYLRETVGEDIQWFRVSASELIYLACVVLLSLIAGLVPAMKAYRTPVATNLVAS